MEIAQVNGFKKGDRIIIISARGEVEGTIVSAVNYGGEGKENWYIELTDQNNMPVYWKQEVDGGSCRKVD